MLFALFFSPLSFFLLFLPLPLLLLLSSLSFLISSFLFPVSLLSSRARDINSAQLRDIGANKLCINYAKKGNTLVQ